MKTLKMSDSYFIRNDSNELNLFNYKKLNNGEILKVKIILSNDSLYQMIKKDEMIIKGAISFIRDPVNLYNEDPLLLSKNDSSTKKWIEMVNNFTVLIPEYSHYLDPVLLKNVKWNFKRPTKNDSINGKVWGLHYANLSKDGLIKPYNQINGIANFLSYERLYRFANKYYFTNEIKINNN